VQELTTTLKVPREHQKYIEKNGVHSVIYECMKILESNQKRFIEKSTNEARIRGRQDLSVQKFVNNQQRKKQEWTEVSHQPQRKSFSIPKELDPTSLLNKKLEMGQKESLSTMQSPSNLSFIPFAGAQGLPHNYSSLIDLENMKVSN